MPNRWEMIALIERMHVVAYGEEMGIKEAFKLAFSSRDTLEKTLLSYVDRADHKGFELIS